VRLFAVLVLAGLSLTARAGSFGRCGGDGPQPFHEITSPMPKATALPLHGPVEEFHYWEGRNQIIYRNHRTDIFAKSLSTAWEAYLGKSQVAFSPVQDGLEEAVLLDRIPAYFFRGVWHNFYIPVARPRHLFWERNFLFLLENQKPTASHAQELIVHRYRMGLQSARPHCRFVVKKGERLEEAEGAQYPYVPFYGVTTSGQGKFLTIYEMDVRTCDVAAVGTYTEPFEADILSVHHFAMLGARAVHTNHATKSLLWDYGSGCEYYDIGQNVPLIPNYSRPIVAVFDKDKGLELMNLTSRNRAVFFPPGQVKSLRARDIRLATHSNRLLFAPEIDVTYGRMLLEVDVKEIAQ
jgi:hypothetical protein